MDSKLLILVTIAAPVFTGCASGHSKQYDQKTPPPPPPPPAQIVAAPIFTAGLSPEAYRTNLQEALNKVLPRVQRVIDTSGESQSWGHYQRANVNELVYTYASLTQGLKTPLKELCGSLGGSFTLTNTPKYEQTFHSSTAADDNYIDAADKSKHEYWGLAAGDIKAKCIRPRSNELLFDFELHKSLWRVNFPQIAFSMSTASDIKKYKEIQDDEKRKREQKIKENNEKEAARLGRIKREFAKIRKGTEDLCLSEPIPYEFRRNLLLNCQMVSEQVTLEDLQANGWTAIEIQTRNVEYGNYVITKGFQYHVRLKKQR